MVTKSLAILLAVVGLLASALTPTTAQAHGRWGGGGGWHGGGFGGFRAPGGGRPFGGRPFGPRTFGGRPFGGGPFGGRPFGGPGQPYGGGRPYGGFGVYRGYGGYAPPYGGTPGYGGGPGGYGGYGGARAAFGAGNWGEQQNAVRQAVREGRQVPLSQAIEAVRRRAPGHELDAGMETAPNGRPAYRVRWAGQDGRRQDYLVDAGTGAVIGPQAGGARGFGQAPPWGGP